MHTSRPTIAPPRGRSAAFTLIEVLVVISIVVILLAVSVPTIRALTKGNSQKQAVNLMTTMLANARATAISTRKTSGIVVYEYPLTNSVTSPTQATSFIQPITQTAYNGATKVRFFNRVPGTGPQRLPSGIQVATLDMGANAFRTQAANTDTSTGGVLGANCRVILFDSNGQLLMANGLAIEATNTDPVAFAWNLRCDPEQSTTQVKQSVTRGSSSPGFLVYDAGLFVAQHNATASTDATWLQQNSDVIVVNAYTGNVIR
jgi:prepilin-type N-terminal cleavage/methylation domain-containing protein